MKTIELKCGNCLKIFNKDLREYNRQIKLKRIEFFCTRTCAAVKNNKNNPRAGNLETLKSDNRKDQFTPFRWFILRAEYRDRAKNYGCDITVEYLKELWGKQNGICPFTGWKLFLPKDTKIGWEINDPANASLDRIDNSKGYLKGNVRFISVMANFGKNLFTDEQLKDFCKAVTNND